MPNPVWPTELPQYVDESGYEEKSPETVLESQMDAGPAKLRRRFTTAYRPFRLSISCDAEQVPYFDTFYETTTAFGTIPFDWVHPRTRAAGTFRFRKPPPAKSVFGGTNVRIAFVIEQIA